MPRLVVATELITAFWIAGTAGSGGLSSVFSRPFYQDSVAYRVGRQRGVPDVSLNAAWSEC